jgi:hypothetical protein
VHVSVNCENSRRYVTSRKIVVPNPDEVTGLFQLTQCFQPHYGPGVDSGSNSNEYHVSSRA